MDELLCQLSKRVWETRGCRFNAHQRMLQKDIYSNLAIWMLTVVIIAINLLVFCDVYSSKANIITIFTISLSIFVLSISQYVYARDYKSKALNYHSCGCDLSVLLDKIEIKKHSNKLTEDDLEKLSNIYSQ